MTRLIIQYIIIIFIASCEIFEIVYFKQITDLRHLIKHLITDDQVFTMFKWKARLISLPHVLFDSFPCFINCTYILLPSIKERLD